MFIDCFYLNPHRFWRLGLFGLSIDSKKFWRHMSMRRQIRFLGHCVKNFDLILFFTRNKTYILVDKKRSIYYSRRAKLSQDGPKRPLKPAREASRDTTCMPNYIFICSLEWFNPAFWFRTLQFFRIGIFGFGLFSSAKVNQKISFLIPFDF